jgi:hypothetical protein
MKSMPGQLRIVLLVLSKNAQKRPEGAPHTIYEELWHAAFWQRIARRILCTDRPGLPLREKSVRDLLERTAAHGQYYLGWIVLLRQLLNTWPPPSGGCSCGLLRG